MAEENPQDVNPATNPQVEDAPSAAVPVAEIDTAPTPVAPATNPEIPQPTIAAESPTAPPPDEAFLEAEAVKENRWIQAAATNPLNQVKRSKNLVLLIPTDPAAIFLVKP